MGLARSCSGRLDHRAGGGGLLGGTWGAGGDLSLCTLLRASGAYQQKTRGPRELGEPPSSVMKEGSDPDAACPTVGSRAVPPPSPSWFLPSSEDWAVSCAGRQAAREPGRRLALPTPHALAGQM